MSGDAWPEHGVLQAREINVNLIPGIRSGGPKPRPGTHKTVPPRDDVGEHECRINSVPAELEERLESSMASNRKVLWAIFWTGFVGTGALVWIGVELRAERLAMERAATLTELPKEEGK